MTDTSQPESDQSISQLSQSLAKAADSQCSLAEKMSVFAKDESLRFANLRLERNGATLDKLQSCHGIPGLIGVQQEWLRAFVEDYLGQQMRLAGVMRGLAHEVAVSAAETASENIDRMSREGREMAEAVGNQVSQVARETNSFVQETQH